jgi:hypothetical protein
MEPSSRRASLWGWCAFSHGSRSPSAVGFQEAYASWREHCLWERSAPRAVFPGSLGKAPTDAAYLPSITGAGRGASLVSSQGKVLVRAAPTAAIGARSPGSHGHTYHSHRCRHHTDHARACTSRVTTRRWLAQETWSCSSVPPRGRDAYTWQPWRACGRATLGSIRLAPLIAV